MLNVPAKNRVQLFASSRNLEDPLTIVAEFHSSQEAASRWLSHHLAGGNPQLLAAIRKADLTLGYGFFYFLNFDFTEAFDLQKSPSSCCVHRLRARESPVCHNEWLYKTYRHSVVAIGFELHDIRSTNAYREISSCCAEVAEIETVSLYAVYIDDERLKEWCRSAFYLDRITD